MTSIGTSPRDIAARLRRTRAQQVAVPPVRRLWGVVQSVQVGPPSLTVKINGSSASVSGISYVTGYVPRVGDVVEIGVAGSDLVVVGAMADGLHGPSNELAASGLSNVASAGDAGNRADHFLGSTLASRWTQVGAAPSATTMGYSAFGVFCATSASVWIQPYTPSGQLQVHARVRPASSSGSFAAAGVIVRDTTASGDTTGNAVLAQIDTSSNALTLFSLESGVYTSRASVTLTAAQVGGGWSYIFLARDASNNWTAFWSGNRVTWVNSSSWSKAFTVAAAGFRASGGVTGQNVDFDLFDVVI